MSGGLQILVGWWERRVVHRCSPPDDAFFTTRHHLTVYEMSQLSTVSMVSAAVGLTLCVYLPGDVFAMLASQVPGPWPPRHG